MLKTCFNVCHITCNVLRIKKYVVFHGSDERVRRYKRKVIQRSSGANFQQGPTCMSNISFFRLLCTFHKYIVLLNLNVQFQNYDDFHFSYPNLNPNPNPNPNPYPLDDLSLISPYPFIRLMANYILFFFLILKTLRVI